MVLGLCEMQTDSSMSGFESIITNTPRPIPSRPEEYRRNNWAVRYQCSVSLGGCRSKLNASKKSNHTEELWYNETACLWMTIYIVPSRVLKTMAKVLTTAIRVMQSTSSEQSTQIFDCAKCTRTKFNTICVRLPSWRRLSKWLSGKIIVKRKGRWGFELC